MAGLIDRGAADADEPREGGVDREGDRVNFLDEASDRPRHLLHRDHRDGSDGIAHNRRDWLVPGDHGVGGDARGGIRCGTDRIHGNPGGGLHDGAGTAYGVEKGITRRHRPVEKPAREAAVTEADELGGVEVFEALVHAMEEIALLPRRWRRLRRRWGR